MGGTSLKIRRRRQRGGWEQEDEKEGIERKSHAPASQPLPSTTCVTVVQLRAYFFLGEVTALGEVVALEEPNPWRLVPAKTSSC